MQLSLKELKKFREYNRTRLEDWLSTWASSSKGIPKTHPDERITREGFGPQGPGGISMARLEAMLSEDIKRTDRLLQGVVDELSRARPKSYRNLTPVYWDAYASDGYLEFWRQSNLPVHQLRYEMSEKAIEWMLDEAERNLAHLGWRRLVVLAPWHSTKKASDLVDAEQRYAVDYYYKMLDEAERWAYATDKTQRWVLGEAMRRTVERTGYSEQSIRRLRSETGISNSTHQRAI